MTWLATEPPPSRQEGVQHGGLVPHCFQETLVNCLSIQLLLSGCPNQSLRRLGEGNDWQEFLAG